MQAALAAAPPRACITVRPGDYGDITLPRGVSLLGRGAALVHVAGVTVGPGSGARVRGVSVGPGGIVVADGAVGVLVDSVKVVAGGFADGIRVGAGASVEIRASEIEASQGHGIRAFDPGAVTLRTSLVGPSGGPGLWAQCANGCDCAASPEVKVNNTRFRENGTVGVSLVGVAAMLSEVDIVDPSNPDSIEVPGGLAAFGCTSLTAPSLRVRDTTPFDKSYGVLIDGASATLGGSEAQNVELVGHAVGLWMQNLSATGVHQVTVQRCRVHDSRGVGIGMSGETTGGIIINWTEVQNTQLATMAIVGGARDTIGDGIVWQNGARAEISNLKLVGNARLGMLIDGDVGEGSRIENIELGAGDDEIGLVHQNVDPDGVSPIVGGGVPDLIRDAARRFTVAAPMNAPIAAP
ncbi:hypothetical protein WMF28_21765 [Sorangium sp. So ce590]|uniref:hypothetical protein n=1 Tax=Sorangium sp. So ce590 TaxID=3133317 RepID=UPI003F61A79E